jgi:DNA-directed RNA polymerase subunit RPC12/RpoP
VEVDQIEDSVNDDHMGDRLHEDPNIEFIEEAGPNGEQLPVVVQQAVCGGDSPPLSDYEKLRERNIRERDEAMKEALEEIEEGKQEMRDNAPGAKKRGAEEEAVGRGRSKRKKVETVVEVRRSGRDRKPVSYVVEEETEGRSRRGRKEGNGSRAISVSPVGRRGRKADTKQVQHPVPTPSTRNLRPRQPVNYAEDPEPEADGYIWCTPCGKEEYNGCECHPPFFGDTKEFNLVVGPSGVEGKDVGYGVFNRGKIIPEGVLFGPYSGNFITASAYKEIEKAKLESGNAWEVRDKENKLTVGYMDPGVNPDPRLHWMSKINCPSQAGEQNLVGFQLAGQIYYRAMKDVATDTELLVWYGSTYAMNLGIKVETIDKFKGKEDQVKEAVVCKFCNTGMAGEEKLEDHLEKGVNGRYKCGVRQAMEMVRMAKSGERKHVCQVCGKGFKENAGLTIHFSVHSKVKLIQCDVEGCDKSYKDRSSMWQHKRAAHESVKYECEECGRRFNTKGSMMRHNKIVHLEDKDYKCSKCGVQFSLNSHLTIHMKTVHDKVRAFRCEHCGKSFGLAGSRKKHVEGVHLDIRYPCNWPDCDWTTNQKANVKYHRRRAHTQEWSLECQLCEDQLDIWWGCILPGEMDKHRAKKHPVEWEEEQETYKRDHPYICKFEKCLNRFGTKVEKERHESKMH